MLDGIHGARSWCRHGILAHNLTKTATKPESDPNLPSRPRPPSAATTQTYF